MITLPTIGTLMVCWPDENRDHQAYIITSVPGDNEKAERQQYIAGCKDFLQRSYPSTWKLIPLLVLPLEIQNTGEQFFEEIQGIVEQINDGTYTNDACVSINAGELFL